MEILLISDPKAAMSAAAVVVGAGSWNDPKSFPGMAHFCEHMLFMGTKAYPDENKFLKLVSDHGGLTNAMTASDRTVYIFSSDQEGFFPLLDQFAHFFIDPLFKKANIAREMYAVDQEFAKSLENDNWRTMMVLKETGNPQHPNCQFSCGNSATLSKIPQSALVDWHRAHYSADRMRAILYSSLDLEELKKQASLKFGQVPVAPQPIQHPSIPLTSTEQQGAILYIRPVMEKRNVSLIWELPPSLSRDPSHSADLIAYTLTRGQKSSLYEVLREEELIETLSIQVDQIGGKDQQFFEVSLDLTEKGLKHPEQAILKFFDALSLLSSSGVPHYLFDEMNQAATYKYQYQSRQDPFTYAMNVALMLPDEPMETFPREQILASTYSPEKISETIEWLKPNRCLYVFLAPTTEPLNRKEKWMGADYAIREVPSNWNTLWASASPHSEIRLPEPNPFLPSQLTLVSDQDEHTTPILLSEHELGCAYYARCGAFQNPETAIYLHILSPELGVTARSEVLAELYVDFLTDQLHPVLSAASQAGLKAKLRTNRSRFEIEINGFSQKAPLLLETILSHASLPPPSKEQFEDLYRALEREYANSQKQLSFRQAKELTESLLCPDRMTTAQKKLALQQIGYDDFVNFQQKLFASTYIEGFFGGNLTLKEAQKAWLDVIHLLGKSPFPKEKQPKDTVASLPSGPYSILKETSVLGNATLLLIDEGLFTFEKRAAQEIGAVALKEAFFNELRSKQKTGYIAQSDAQEIRGRLFQFFVVQSNSHQPEELLYRFELFLEEFVSDLKTNLDLQRFELVRNGCITSIKNRISNLKDRCAFWDLLAFQYKGDFQFLDQRIEALQSLTYEKFIDLVQEFFSRQNKKRVAVLYEGKLPSPFAYEATTPQSFAEIALSIQE